MAARTMPDPTPTPWGPAHSHSNESGSLATLDDLVGADDGGLIAVDGPRAELSAVASHLARRAQAAGRRCIVADGNVVDEPWREVALSLGVPLAHDAAATARAIGRALGDAVAIITEAHPTAWGAAVVAELASAQLASAQLASAQVASAPGSSATPVWAPAAIVLLGHRGRDGVPVIQLDSVASPRDLASYYDGLIEASRDRVASLSALSRLEGWWRGRGVGDGMASLSLGARRLLDHIALAERSCSHEMLEAMSDSAALDELTLSGKLAIHNGRARITDADDHRGQFDVVAAGQVGAALLAHEPDPWAAMRAAELFAAAGDVARAHAAAFGALRGAQGVALRNDLWDRFDQALGSDLDDDAIVRYGQLALESGDIGQAQRLARRGNSQHSYPLALLAGRTALARGNLRRARSALTDAIALATDEQARAEASVEMAELELVCGDRTGAHEHADRAITLSNELETQLAASNVIGKAHLADGQWNEAVDRFAHDEERALGNGHEVAALRARLNRAIAIMSQGRRLEAQALLEDIQQGGEALGDRRATCFALANLSVLATLGHDYAEGIRLVELAIEQMRPLGDTLRLARQIINLAGLRLSVGLVDEAEQALAFGRQACGSNLGDALVCNLSVVKARVNLAKGNTMRAASAVQEAIEAANRSSDGAKLGEACRLASRVALEDGDVARARRFLERSRDAASGPSADAETTLIEAAIERAAGNDFSSLAADALELASADDDVNLGREAHELCARAAHLEDDVETAYEHLDAALRLRDRVAASLTPTLRSRYLERAEIARLGALQLRWSSERQVERTIPSHASPEPPTRRRRERRQARELVGDSQAMRALRSAIAKVGKSATTVLVQGESGTGKELVADALHHASGRAEGPLVKVNCAALVETLLLSELFGHEKGAFTGASSRKRGRFEQANGGTIFLDEIGDISPKTQVALLRVLQERSFERVGGVSPISVDVRVVCATHRDLPTMVADGRFREDLYYRLCGVTLDVPSFRARLDDLPAIAAALLERIAFEQHCPAKQLGDEASDALTHYHWPGNVRELENALRAAALFSEGDVITLADFTDNVQSLADLASPASLAAPMSTTRARQSASPTEAVYAEVRGGQSLPDMKKALERACIERALEETGGNITKAAELLGMKRPRVSQLVNQFARDEVAS
jgi:DNA-binding NtrC family response regulator